MDDERPEHAFTTFEVARLCGAFHATILHWIGEGKLNAFTTTGGRHRVASSDLAAFMRAYELSVPAALEPAPRRILIADDDPAITRIMERSWDHDGDGYAVLAVNDPVRCLVEVGRHQPDVLILDLLMPVLSGYEICRILKAGPATRHVRIIAISARTPSDAQLDFLRDNADMFIRKPFNPGRLIGAVDLLLGPK